MLFLSLFIEKTPSAIQMIYRFQQSQLWKDLTNLCLPPDPRTSGNKSNGTAEGPSSDLQKEGNL